MDAVVFDKFNPKVGLKATDASGKIAINWRDSFSLGQRAAFDADLRACDLDIAWFTPKECPYDVDDAPSANKGIIEIAALIVAFYLYPAVRLKADNAVLEQGLQKLWHLRFRPLVHSDSR